MPPRVPTAGTTTSEPSPNPIPVSDPGLPHPTSTASFWHAPPSSFLHAHRTTPSLPSSVTTLIIGSGLAGSMLFHHLQSSLGPSSSSSSTLMLEARNTCWGATGRNGGHCKPMLYQSGDFIELCSAYGEGEALARIKFEQLNFELMREYIEGEGVDCEWVATPSADVFYEAEPLDRAKRNIDLLRKVAPDVARRLRVVEGRRELRESLRTPTALGAVTFTAGKLSPYKLVSHILEKGVRTQWLNLQTTTPATRVSRSAGNDGNRWAVETPRGTVLADRVVFATNAHTAHLLPAFKGWIYPVRAQMAALIPPKSLKDRPLTHTYGLVRHDRKTACYLIQRPVDEDGGGGELMLGGGREFEENHGVGMQDGSINPQVAHGLRTSIPGYFADETGYETDDFADTRELRKSFIEKFRRLRLGGAAGHDVWDAAEWLGVPEDEEDLDLERWKPAPARKECRAKTEWSGTMGFSRDGRPFVGKVPAVGEEDAERLEIERMDDTRGLWMLAGFEGHGMAFTSGSAKALATMIAAAADSRKNGTAAADSESLYEWFPRTFEVTPARLGLAEVENWEEVQQYDDWEIIDEEG
ncbi:FAD dependent oxidoreductase-domain-containing protein [Tricharina praecox]|uniref:FAD dependent oxidoreductase-domain-containing protein n=1 Tax=Tricharina praecox TaxID=43433 RepID=UPI00221F8551|nr:FAD dependent oxidoreductase-domain-containing protein [Tricharina praecox]KAI5855735.1 FAD dependent oxidoreductase-domain-containing protein [Tricharina praecox]